MADDTEVHVDVAVACRVLGVSRSGYYDWLGRPPSAREEANTLLLKQITGIHEQSRGTYGWPRIHAELVLGLGVEVNHKRVARLMREAGVQGLYRRRTRGGPTGPATEDDLVHRQFAVAAPDRLWLTDITEHPTNEGKLYCCAVMDAYSRRIVGWSIAHHMRTELVLDALGMAIISRRATGSEEDIATILHSDHGTQFTSMGTIGDCYDNSMMKSFWGTCNSRSSTPGLGKRGPRLPTRSSSG
jgi:putative transposase